jgi:hypothetical protein
LIIMLSGQKYSFIFDDFEAMQLDAIDKNII